jgi:micrococcal nuclease
MSKLTFSEDASSRKVVRFLLALQVTGLLLVTGLRTFSLYAPARAVSAFTLIAFAASLAWLYLRYRGVTLVREKYYLHHLLEKFQNNLRMEEDKIQAATQERERLLEAEKSELEAALRTIQQGHIQAGLASASIDAASIPGLGLRLKERLAEQGIRSAADVTQEGSRMPGFGEAKLQALLSWTQSMRDALETSKPAKLPVRQCERIQQKYQSLQEKNGAVESRARSSKELLEHELSMLGPRLRQLSSLTFPHYLSRSLASHGLTAGFLGIGLVAAQLVSAVSATGATQGVTSLQAASGVEVSLPGAASILAITETALPPATDTLQPPPTSTDAPTLAPTSTPQVTLPAALAACLPQTTAREAAQVVEVVDGDTIDVRLGEQVMRVRYIGVDTPEQDEALYGEALAYNQSLVGQRTVTLVKDISETDSFGRLLRYVIAGEVFVNQVLVEQGFAQSMAYAPDTACVAVFEAAQRSAQTVQVGLWLPTEAVLVPPVTGGDATPGCDPSYPGVCIPPPLPDLDCGDISFRRFQVLPPDPHGFDRDNDGVGCES